MTRLLIAAALVAGCAPIDREAANQAALAQAQPIGPAVDCITLSNVSHTRVRGDRVIDFHMRGGTVYRNTLAQSCPGLGFEERFTYRTSIGRLCSVDTITVLQGNGQSQGPTCGLGAFQPIRTSAR